MPHAPLGLLSSATVFSLGIYKHSVRFRQFSWGGLPAYTGEIEALRKRLSRGVFLLGQLYYRELT